MTDDRPLLIEAWLTGHAHREAFEDMSAAQINALPMSEYARLTGREFKIMPAAETAPSAPAGQDPAGVMAAQHPQHATEDPGVDFQAMSMAQYAELRGQLGVGQSRQEGVGIFNAASRQAQLDGVRAQSGRTALNNANVVEPPRLEGRQVRQGDMRDTRTVAERFGVPGNSNTF